MSEEYRMPGKIIDIHNHVARGDDGSRLIELMDAAHIEVTLVLELPILGGTADVMPAVRKYPDRLVGGVFCDPRDGKAAIDRVKHYYDEGYRVVKLFPNLGYYPDDETFRPFFDAIAERKMAVLSHCGWLGFSGENVCRETWASYRATPGRFEKVIRLYPEITFIMAHMGGITGVLETVMLTTRTANTFTDCSPGQGRWALEATGNIAASVPPEKLMWGADCYSQPDLLPEYRRLLVELGYGPHLEKIFYANARKVLEKIGALEPEGRDESV